jgi:hypothetical protein
MIVITFSHASSKSLGRFTSRLGACLAQPADRSLEVRLLGLARDVPLRGADRGKPRRAAQRLERHAQDLLGPFHERRVVAWIRAIKHAPNQAASATERANTPTIVSVVLIGWIPVREMAPTDGLYDDAAERRKPDHGAERLRADGDRNEAGRDGRGGIRSTIRRARTPCSTDCASCRAADMRIRS